MQTPLVALPPAVDTVAAQLIPLKSVLEVDLRLDLGMITWPRPLCARAGDAGHMMEEV